MNYIHAAWNAKSLQSSLLSVTYKSTALFVKIVAQPTISHMKPQPHTVL
jgi:hypothetical protein